MSQKENQNDWKVGVLSPRVTGVLGKGNGGSRRTTMTGMRERETMSVGPERSSHVRLSSVAGIGVVASNTGRGSLMPGSKGVWR